MKTIRHHTSDTELFEKLRRQARMGIFDGSDYCPYLQDCQWFVEKYACVVIFTRDEGYHSCGWWKNPDYERCWHLSISFPSGRNKIALNRIIDGLFGWYKKLMWVEPPYSREGKEAEVWHYRLFCDPAWQPIKPRSEVYSTQFTELGWKSFSELR